MGLFKLGQKLGERLKEAQAEAKIQKARARAVDAIAKEKMKQAMFKEKIRQAKIIGKARERAKAERQLGFLRPARPTVAQTVSNGKKGKKGKNKKGKKNRRTQPQSFTQAVAQQVVRPQKQKVFRPNLSASKFAGLVD